MKTYLCLVSLLGLFLVGSLQGTTVRIQHPRGQALRLVAVCETESAVIPVYYSWLVPSTGFTTTDVPTSKYRLPELSFPDLLLATPSKVFPDASSKPLYIGGEVIGQVDLKSKTWLLTEYFGWVYVANYPDVYSLWESQWLHIMPYEPWNGWAIYSYRDKNWDILEGVGTGLVLFNLPSLPILVQ